MILGKSCNFLNIFFFPPAEKYFPMFRCVYMDIQILLMDLWNKLLFTQKKTQLRGNLSCS